MSSLTSLIGAIRRRYLSACLLINFMRFPQVATIFDRPRLILCPMPLPTLAPVARVSEADRDAHEGAVIRWLRGLF